MRLVGPALGRAGAAARRSPVGRCEATAPSSRTTPSRIAGTGSGQGIGAEADLPRRRSAYNRAVSGPAQRFGSSPRACPFVAFDEDRDRRAQAPDPRHRCYAVPAPEPRALAHQEAYCLAPAFSSCSFFLDWAGRAAAEPTVPAPAAGPGAVAAGAAAAGAYAEASFPAHSRTDPGVPPGPSSGSGASGVAGPGAGGVTTGAGVDAAGRLWTAPPAWSGAETPRPSSATGAPEQLGALPEPLPQPDRDLGDFGPRPGWTPDAPAPSTAESVPAMPPYAAGSYAAGIGAPPVAPSAGPQTWAKPSGSSASASDDILPPSSESENASRYSGRPITVGSPGRVAPQARPAGGDSDGSAEWSQPRRFAAYPTLRSRARVSPIVIGFFVLLLGALLLFLLPGFLSGGSGKTPKPSTPVATETLPATPTPGPTLAVYTVKAGDVLSAIAKQYGVTADQIACYNGLKSVNKISIGQQLTIPPADYVCPQKGGRASPSASPPSATPGA